MKKITRNLAWIIPVFIVSLLAYAGTRNINYTAAFKKPVTMADTLAVTGVLTATGGVAGAITGNITGNVTGNVTGDVTGDLNAPDEVTTILCVADDSDDSDGTYFTISSRSTNYKVWMNVDGGGNNPTAGADTLVPIAVTTDDSADTIAAAVQVALDALDGITATVSTATVTCTFQGDVTDAADVDYGATITVTTAGKDATIESLVGAVECLGAVDMASTLDVVGNTTIGGTLGVTGAITATGGVAGAITGNVTGNLTGDVTGDLTGNIIGNTAIVGTDATGKLDIKIAREVHTLTLSTTSVTTTLQIPVGAMLLGCSMNVDTAVTNDGDNTWTAAFSTGSTTSIEAAGAAAKNSKTDTLIVPEITTTGACEITFTPQSGSFTAGVIEVQVYYMDLTSLDDAA